MASATPHRARRCRPGSGRPRRAAARSPAPAGPSPAIAGAGRTRPRDRPRWPGLVPRRMGEDDGCDDAAVDRADGIAHARLAGWSERGRPRRSASRRVRRRLPRHVGGRRTARLRDLRRLARWTSASWRMTRALHLRRRDRRCGHPQLDADARCRSSAMLLERSTPAARRAAARAPARRRLRRLLLVVDGCALRVGGDALEVRAIAIGCGTGARVAPRRERAVPGVVPASCDGRHPGVWLPRCMRGADARCLSESRAADVDLARSSRRSRCAVPARRMAKIASRQGVQPPAPAAAAYPWQGALAARDGADRVQQLAHVARPCRRSRRRPPARPGRVVVL